MQLSGKADTKRNKGGRPSKAAELARLADEGQAFESIKQKWTFISHKLADEASKAARDHKKLDGKSLVALCTAAGIAYDKRWSKQVADTHEISIPPMLAAQIATKLTIPAQGNQQVSGQVAVLTEDADLVNGTTDLKERSQAGEEPAPDPGQAEAGG